MAIAVVGTPKIQQSVSANPGSFNGVGFTAGGAGNLLVAKVSLRTNVTITSITDAAGQTWTQRVVGSNASSTNKVEFWTAVRNGSATGTLTVNMSGASVISVMIYEISGEDDTTPIGVTQGTTTGDATSDTTYNFGPITPTASENVLIIAGLSWPSTQGVTTYTPSSGWTSGGFQTGSSTLQGHGTVHRIVTGTTGSYSGSVTTNRAGLNGWAMITIRAGPDPVHADSSSTHADVIVTGKTGSTAATSPSPSAYAAAIMATSGVVGYWKLDEASGSSAEDETAGNNLNINGGPPVFSSAGLIGDGTTAFNLGGTNTQLYTDIFTNPSRFSFTNFTYECWTTFTTWTHNTYFFSTQRWATGFNGASARMINTLGSIQFDIETTGGQLLPNISVSMSLNTRYHFVVTYDGSFLKLYLNGSQVYSGAGSGNTTSYSDSYINLGRNAGNNYPGKLDEVAFYNVALAPATVTSHYLAGVAVNADSTGTKGAATATGKSGSTTAVRVAASSSTKATVTATGKVGSTTAVKNAASSGTKATVIATGKAGSTTAIKNAASSGTKATVSATGKVGSTTAIRQADSSGAKGAVTVTGKTGSTTATTQVDAASSGTKGTVTATGKAGATTAVRNASSAGTKGTVTATGKLGVTSTTAAASSFGTKGTVTVTGKVGSTSTSGNASSSGIKGTVSVTGKVGSTTAVRTAASLGTKGVVTVSGKVGATTAIKNAASTGVKGAVTVTGKLGSTTAQKQAASSGVKATLTAIGKLGTTEAITNAASTGVKGTVLVVGKVGITDREGSVGEPPRRIGALIEIGEVSATLIALETSPAAALIALDDTPAAALIELSGVSGISGGLIDVTDVPAAALIELEEAPELLVLIEV